MNALLALAGALCIGLSITALAGATNMGGVATMRRRHELASLIALPDAPSLDKGAVPAILRHRSVALAAGVGILLAWAMGPAVGLLAMAAIPIASRILEHRKARKRTAAFEAALPDALDLMASSLQAGAPLASAMELVAAEGTGPLAEELERVLAEHTLGEPMADALAAAAARAGSRDFAWCVRAVHTQQEFGASLADLLRTLAEFMRWRQELRGEVAALTAEGRLSAGILSGLPFVVCGFFALTSPSYVAVLVTTPIGLMLSVIGLVLLAGGIVWMSRIVKIEV